MHLQIARRMSRKAWKELVETAQKFGREGMPQAHTTRPAKKYRFNKGRLEQSA